MRGVRGGKGTAGGAWVSDEDSGLDARGFGAYGDPWPTSGKPEKGSMYIV